MNVISHETKKAVKDKINLLDYLEQYFEFEKQSGRYFTRCPFHDEDTPSFMVDKNYYHCFGCGESGDIIKFVMRYDNLTFSEAFEKLAAYANVEIKERFKSYTLDVFRSYKPYVQSVGSHPIINEAVYNQYSKTRISLWEQEGIKPDVITDYDVRYDKRASRIVYPVRDIRGRLINIKGRTTVEDFKSLRIPKYINYYKVGKMDYFQGLNKKLSSVKEHKEIIVFEGIKSCMKLDGWVNSPCVSSETANLTPEQVEQLLRLHCDVVIAYDKDKTLGDIAHCIRWLSRFTNVYVILDEDDLLGGRDDKQSPVDMGYEIWQELYRKRKRVRL